MDWSGTPDDPSGYFKMRAFLHAAARQLSDLDAPTADAIRSAADNPSLPSEWLGQAALAIRATLDLPSLPADLRLDLQSALDAIRQGFRRVGDIPNF
jgi:hypothetical protein